MRVTGPDISRRTVLLACFVSCARAADPAADVWELIAGIAAALGHSDAGGFLNACDPAMPGFASLRADVTALTDQVDVESAIDPVRNEGDDRARAIEVDWLLRLIDRTGLGRVTSRRATVKCRVEKRGRKWRLVSFEPSGFFAPPSA
jgi:hypothetical protein